MIVYPAEGLLAATENKVYKEFLRLWNKACILMLHEKETANLYRQYGCSHVKMSFLLYIFSIIIQYCFYRASLVAQ